MRKPKWKSWLIASSVVLLAVAAWSTLRWRTGDYRVAAEKYAEYANAYESTGEYGFSSCYGSRWDNYSGVVQADLRTHTEDRAYRDDQAARYHRLRKKYEEAAQSSWRLIPLDPPLRS